jgi:hypothetical protein
MLHVSVISFSFILITLIIFHKKIQITNLHIIYPQFSPQIHEKPTATYFLILFEFRVPGYHIIIIIIIAPDSGRTLECS